MSEGSVEVTVPVPEPVETPVDTGPEVVVVDTGSDGTSAADITEAHAAGRLEAELEALRAEVAELRNATANAEDVAVEAGLRADSAAATAESVLDDVATDLGDALDIGTPVIPDIAPEIDLDAEIEEDNTPEKPHLVHRSFRDLFGKDRG